MKLVYFLYKDGVQVSNATLRAAVKEVTQFTHTKLSVGGGFHFPLLPRGMKWWWWWGGWVSLLSSFAPPFPSSNYLPFHFSFAWWFTFSPSPRNLGRPVVRRRHIHFLFAPLTMTTSSFFHYQIIQVSQSARQASRCVSMWKSQALGRKLVVALHSPTSHWFAVFLCNCIYQLPSSYKTELLLFFP